MDFTEFLSDVWYLGLPSKQLKPGKPVRKIIAGQPVMLGRDAQGRAFALRDICPHRGVPLSEGRVVNGDEVECPYHGWRFGPNGRCRAIPSLVSDQAMDIEKIRVRAYPVEEKQGLVWVYVSSGALEGPALDTSQPPSSPPDIPGPGDGGPKHVHTVRFDCHIDNAVLGLMDPAHGPYVHQSWFWRSAAKSYEKQKRFAPVERGWVMIGHPPSSNSFAYKLLGGKPVTEITFKLPGVRHEYIKVGERFVTSLTIVTPIDETTTEVTQCLYWDHPVLSVLRPVAGLFAHIFLDQDRAIIEKQNEGLKYNPRLMLIPDADTQAKWYFKLKKAWSEAKGDPGQAAHPLKGETTLRWRT